MIENNGYLTFTRKSSCDIVLIKCILPLNNKIKEYLSYLNNKNCLDIKKFCITMNRKISENISLFTKRLSINLRKQFENYFIRRYNKTIKVEVFSEITDLNQEYNNKKIEDLMEIDLTQICEINFIINNEYEQKFYCLVKKDVDIVQLVTIRNEIRWGLPVVPLVTFYKGEIENFKYSWYIYKFTSEENNKCEQILDLPEEAIEIDNNYICDLNINDIELNNEIINNIEDYCLILRIKNNFEESELFDTIYRFNNVKRPLERSWCKKRIDYFRRDLKYDNKYMDRIRIVSFNILSELFCQTTKALNEMYTSCPNFALESFYRRSLLARELIDLDSDIFCLQEIQLSFYDSFLSILLNQKGYFGIFHTFGSICTFYKKKLFNLIETDSFLFRNLIQNYTELIESIKTKWPSFIKNVLENISTVFQIVVLRHRKTGTIYLFANTHLFYHQYGGHIRILQVKVFIDLINNYLERLKNTFSSDEIITLIMGDFNTLPFSDARMLLINGYIDKDSPDWLHSKIYNYKEDSDLIYIVDTENEKNYIHGFDLEIKNKCIDLFDINIDKKYNNIKICCKDQRIRGKVTDSKDFNKELYYPFTNKVDGFSGQLDYIYLLEQEHIVNKYEIYLNKYLLYVEESSLIPTKILPSPEYSSDHISVGIDITFKRKH